MAEAGPFNSKSKQSFHGNDIIVFNVLNYLRDRNPDKSLAWVVAESALALGNFPLVEKVAESIWSYKPQVKQEIEFATCATGTVKIVPNVYSGGENASESGHLFEPQIKIEQDSAETQDKLDSQVETAFIKQEPIEESYLCDMNLREDLLSAQILDRYVCQQCQHLKAITDITSIASSKK